MHNLRPYGLDFGYYQGAQMFWFWKVKSDFFEAYFKGSSDFWAKFWSEYDFLNIFLLKIWFFERDNLIFKIFLLSALGIITPGKFDFLKSVKIFIKTLHRGNL